MSTYPSLAHKRAVISGAGGNLGIAVIKRLQAEGASLALIDHSLDGLRKRLGEQGLNPDSLMIVGGIDLTKKDQVDQAVAQISADGAPIDILINIAGGFRAEGAVHESTETLWDYLMDLNGKSAYLLSAAVTPVMIGGGRGGRIVNVGSRAALSGVAGIAIYSASKSSVLRLTEAMAEELKPFQITVNAVLPSVIDTPQNRSANPAEDYTKWVSPESLADVIAFLISDAARDISGALIPVYGRA
ncbi:MAG: SDR family NAD(P)-dependent oxidoreductase [Anaerolinea sp.]|nr:SDR family NAD(P)-dependent oxidoreductase [Anaerolinea sp.]